MTDKNRLSAGNAGGQQHGDENPHGAAAGWPDIWPSPAAGDDPLPGGPVGDDEDDGFDHDCDTALEEVVPMTTGQADDDTDPHPPANASAAVRTLVIHAPRGPQPVTPGYTVAAVKLERGEDGEDDILDAAYVTRDKLQSHFVATGVAAYKAQYPKDVPAWATHVVVNDHTGREVFRSAVQRRRAA
jgi:hypothetical protein